MINNRQAGRRRGRGGGNNNGPRQGNPGRPDGGNRIDSRARGNASQLLEKYKNLAADAQRQGDRVNTEYYLQFADHYFRVLSEQRGRFEDQQPARQGRDQFDLDGAGEFGDEFGDEGEPMRAREQWGEQGGEQPRADREDRGERQDRPDRQRDERPREARREGGEQRPAREWQERGERRPREDRPRDDRPREDRPRDDRQRDNRPVEVAGQRRAEPLAANESLESRAEDVLEADRPLDAPQPRRRGRPRRDESGDGAGEGAPAAFEADRLPPSLTLAANDAAPAEPKPRRRRARPAEEDTPTAAE